MIRNYILESSTTKSPVSDYWSSMEDLKCNDATFSERIGWKWPNWSQFSKQMQIDPRSLHFLAL